MKRAVEDNIISIHREGKGYRKIANTLSAFRTAIGNIISKFKTIHTDVTFPGQGRKKWFTSTEV